jgi:hypothetical protein
LVMCAANAALDLAGILRDEGAKMCVHEEARRAMCSSTERLVKAERKEVAMAWREEWVIDITRNG